MRVLLDVCHPYGSAYVVLHENGSIEMGSWQLDTSIFESVDAALEHISEQQKTDPDHMNIAKSKALRECLNMPLH